MKHQKTFEVALLAAREILVAEKRLWPECESAVAVKVSGGTSSESNEFSRAGTAVQDSGWTLPASFIDLINQNASAAAPNSALNSASGLTLLDLLNRSDTSVPYLSDITSTLQLSPTGFTGETALQSMAQRDPFSSTYEADTADAFNTRAQTALSQGISGPSAVRGGTNRAALAQGEMSTRLGQERGREIRGAQAQDAAISSQANQILQAIANARRALQLQAQGQVGQQALGRSGQALQAASTSELQKGANMGTLALGSQLVGNRQSTTTENRSGRGSGDKSFVQGESGLACCFIFLEALNGKLPWFIENARRDFYTPQRRRGYKWMARWLVPKMQQKPWVKHLVNKLLVRPFLSYGGWLYGAAGYSKGWLFSLYCAAWLGLWNQVGKVVRCKDS